MFPFYVFSAYVLGVWIITTRYIWINLEAFRLSFLLIAKPEKCSPKWFYVCIVATIIVSPILFPTYIKVRR